MASTAFISSELFSNAVVVAVPILAGFSVFMLLVRFCGNGAVAVPLSEVKRPEKEKASAGVEQFKDMTLEELRSIMVKLVGSPCSWPFRIKFTTFLRPIFSKEEVTMSLQEETRQELWQRWLHNTESLDDPRTDDLNLAEIDTLNEWIMKFDSKYPVVGRVIRSGKDKKEG